MIQDPEPPVIQPQSYTPEPSFLQFWGGEHSIFLRPFDSGAGSSALRGVVGKAVHPGSKLKTQA